MRFIFNPLVKTHKSVTGGIEEFTAVTFNVISDCSSVIMHLYSDNEHIARLFNKNGELFVLELSLKAGLYFYCFEADGKMLYADEKLNAALNSFNKWQLTVYPKDYSTPDWIKGGVIYQIFPDRFCKSGDFSVEKGKVARKDWGGLPTFRSQDGKVRNNEFFGGNFKGIESKLDYLKKLNVTAIYLNPVCKSYSSHRYDTGDYLEFDEVLGTKEDFKNLVSQAEKRGISFIFDGVFNHTGAGSRYFNKYGDYAEAGAYNDKNSPYYDWYDFKTYPDDYACWWDFKTLPSIKKDSESFQNFIAGSGGVISEWVKLGIKGLRLDVVDELSDDFTKKIRLALKAESADNLLIGEVWEDATNKIAYGVRRKYFSGGELDSVMNYPLRNAIFNFILSGRSDELQSTVLAQINNYPPCALHVLMNILSTHDSPRAITVLGRRNAVTDKDLMADEKLDDFEYARGKTRLKCASVLQFCLYGVPSVYYGDEEGLEGDLDPYNRRCFDWDNIDEELLSHFIKLSDIRKKNRAFILGETKVVYAKNGLFVFTRECKGQKITIAVNAGGHAQEITFLKPANELYSNTKNTKFTLSNMEFIIAEN